MAIKRYAGDRFTGLSTDIKPTNILSGTQFTELDTGKIFFYNGTSWLESTVEMIGGDGVNITGETISVDLAANSGLEFLSNKLQIDIKPNTGLGKDANGLFINSSIAGTGLTWTNGVLSGYEHPTFSTSNSSVTGINVLRGLTFNNGHVTGVSTGELPVGAAADATNYTRIAPLDNNDLVPLSYLPADAKTSKVVANITERNAITGSDLYEGLRVHVLDASSDGTVASGHAGYIYTGTVWEKTYEEEILDIFVPSANGVSGRVQLSNGSGDFISTANLHFSTAANRLELTGGMYMKEGGTAPTVSAGQAYSYVETETVGLDTITRVMTRLGDGTDVILASYIA